MRPGTKRSQVTANKTVKKLTKSILLDDIPDDVIKQKSTSVVTRLRWYLFISFILEAAIFGFFIFFLSIYWEFPFMWTLIVRLPGQLRFVLLAWAFCIKIPVVKMVGTGKLLKSPRALAACTPVGLWAWIGLVDLALIRIPFLFVDIIYFGVFGVVVSLSTLLHFVIIICNILEYYITVYFVYYVGIRRGVRLAFLVRTVRRKGDTSGISLSNSASLFDAV